MEGLTITEAIERIARMEQCFDALQAAAAEKSGALWEDAALKERLRQLTAYYESGRWLQDYELDEQGLLPKDLKRGVLSQDGVHDFLERVGKTHGSMRCSGARVTECAAVIKDQQEATK